MTALQQVGLDAKAGQPATSLSFGELKLLELARALVGEPSLLLLDEPAAGVAAADLGRLADVIRRVNALEVTVLLVEHNMRLVMNISHDILVLNFGRKIAEGPAEKIRTDRAVIEAYLGEETADA
jgi:branched-chain amino acid transport system ATP-binding protein